MDKALIFTLINVLANNILTANGNEIASDYSQSVHFFKQLSEIPIEKLIKMKQSISDLKHVNFSTYQDSDLFYESRGFDMNSKMNPKTNLQKNVASSNEKHIDR